MATVQRLITIADQIRTAMLEVDPSEFVGVGSIVISLDHPTDVLGKGLEITVSINPTEPEYMTRTIEAHEENE